MDVLTATKRIRETCTTEWIRGSPPSSVVFPKAYQVHSLTLLDAVRCLCLSLSPER